MICNHDNGRWSKIRRPFNIYSTSEGTYLQLKCDCGETVAQYLYRYTLERADK